MTLTSTQKKENNIVELEIAVSAEELRAATDKIYKQKAKTMTVPGFRKGKAPRKIIETMYGEGVFVEDAVNELYPSAYNEAVDEAGIEPVDKADVELLNVDKETGFTFKATVTVKPEVNIQGYKGLAGKKIIRPVEEKDIDSEIDRMRQRNARILTVTERAAQTGDDTVIDFEGFVDGVAFEGGKSEGFPLTLGSGSFIDGFEEQIAGHNVDDEFDVNVTFPEEYHAEELKGKPALFKVKLCEIKSKELPEADDEFAKDVSEFDTLAELKSDIRAKMQEERDNRAKDDLENQLMDTLADKLEGEIPECMYAGKQDELLRDFGYRLSTQGMDLQTYMQYTGMDEQALRQSFRERAERQVKVRLALEKVAELENIQASEEAVEQEYQNLADAYKMEVSKVKEIVREKDLAADLKTQKAVDLIRDNAVIEEVPEEQAADNADTEEPAASTTKKAETEPEA